MNGPTYMRTAAGQIVERETCADRNGNVGVRNLTTGKFATIAYASLTPMSDSEVIAMARAELAVRS